MRDPLALGPLTGAGFQPADKNVNDEFRGTFRVRSVCFQSHPGNESMVYVGYPNMDAANNFEVLRILLPGEVYEIVRPSVDRLLRLEDYGVELADPSEVALVTAGID
jgi:hypothetical protein